MSTPLGNSEDSRERLADEICSAANALKGVAGLLASTPPGREQAEYLQRIHSGADQILEAARRLQGARPVRAAEKAPERPAIEPARSGRRLLLVEDNLINRRVVRRLLENLGHHVETAEDGQVALEMTKGSSFDLVFMDIQMPVMDGLEATRRIRSEVDASRQPWIVALTAAVLHQSVCIDAGADDFLAKPVQSEHLQRAVDMAGTRRTRAS